MKQGRTLEDLAKELCRRHAAKRDFRASTEAMEMVVRDSDVGFSLGSAETFGINELGHDQIGGSVQIPSAYYDRMRANAPALLASNVNTWLHREPRTHLVRVLDGNVRAFLGNSYRRIDNYEMVEAVYPVLAQMKLIPVSCEVTDHRLYMKFVHPDIERQIQKIKPGAHMGDGSSLIFDTCVPALSISNSEVGSGRAVVESGMLTKACTNLCWWPGAGWKRRHVGVRHEILAEVGMEELLSDDTKRVTDQAILMQIRDVVANCFNVETFEKRVAQISETTGNEMTKDPVKVVELTAEKFGFSETERTSVLMHLAKGGDFSQYGLFNAVTRAAQDVESYDRATELEHTGFKVVELGRDEWKDLAVEPSKPTVQVKVPALVS